MLGFEIQDIVIAIVVVCLILWRMSYGANNGLFAEAAGLISVLASFASIYYIIKIVGDVLNKNLGSIITKIGYLFVAFLIYKIMNSLVEHLRKIKEIPILGGLDRLLGALLGMVEAAIIIKLFVFITGIEIMPVVIRMADSIYAWIKSLM